MKTECGCRGYSLTQTTKVDAEKCQYPALLEKNRQLEENFTIACRLIGEMERELAKAATFPLSEDARALIREFRRILGG